MVEYIDREAVLNILASKNAPWDGYQKVSELPSADVAPVVHGRWISVGHKLSRICSVCDRDEPYKFADDNANVYDYCPHCGARMDGAE